MTDAEAIALVKKLLPSLYLTHLQETVFKQSWLGHTYTDIAISSGYDAGYIKDVGSELWRSLSKVLNIKVTKNNLQTVLKHYAKTKQGELTALKFPNLKKTTDMGEAIDVSKFYGRTQELATLKQWILGDRCRVIALIGMGGLGKTSLSVKIAEELKGEFSYVIWRSLRHAPAFEDKVTDLIKIISDQEVVSLPNNWNEQITCLIEYLRKFRCLLVLDNFDTILEHGAANEPYLKNYEAYGEFLWRLGETSHQSCILITSREKPPEIATLEGDALPLRTFNLSGLETTAAQAILSLKGLSGTESETNKLIDCYGGNPLALKIAATAIRDLHEDRIENFLAEGKTLFKGIGNLIDQQFKKLSDSEQEVMYWLAIHRESVTLQDLQADFILKVSQANLITTLTSLRWRSLIENMGGGYTQQPVVMEYVTEKLIDIFCQEIITATPQYLFTHALIQAQEKDYIRDSQRGLIVQAIVHRLEVSLGSKQRVQQQLNQMIENLQRSRLNDQEDQTRGLSPLPKHLSKRLSTDHYGAANLLNLLVQLGIDLTGYDFSGLTFRNCDLRSLKLHDINFSQATFHDCLFAGNFGSVTSVAFSPDGNYLATSDTNGCVYIWEAATSKQLILCKEEVINRAENIWIWSIAFSPNHPILASSGLSTTIQIWDINTGKILRSLDEHTRQVTLVVFSPDGKLLASASHDHTVKIWDVATGKCLQTLAGHEACVWAVAFHPQGKILASAGEDQLIKIWELRTGKCIQDLAGHQHWVKAIAFSPNGQMLASGSFDFSVKIWNLDTGLWDCAKTLLGHKGVVTSVVFSPTGDRLVSGCYDNSIRVWDVESGQCLDTLNKHSNRIWSVAFHPDGNLIASGGDDHAIKIWELRTGKCTKTLQGHSNAVYGIAYNSAQKILVSGHEDQTIKIWDLTLNQSLNLTSEQITVQPALVLTGHSNRVFSVSLSPDGNLLASASGDRTIRLWNPQTGENIKTLYGHQSWVWKVLFSPDGKLLASGSYDRTIKIWDMQSGECLQTLVGHPSSLLELSFSHDGKELFSCGYQRSAKRWNLATGECLLSWEADDHDRVWAIAVSPDDRWVVTGGDDRMIKFWDVQTGECLRQFSGHTSQILDLLFTPQGDRLISCSSDRTIKIWDVITGACINTLPIHLNWVWAISLVKYLSTDSSQDPEILFSSSWDGTIKSCALATDKVSHTMQSILAYKGMIINDVTGLTQAEIESLKALGALDTSC
ncbi:MAG: NB-ARC domain-containing protein [Pseudanabaenaceae cyanobacterium bins.39]|nr:NB-ARC domain-containing protein [Pseudanabaenaceae cyanobacterium bins.39]